MMQMRLRTILLAVIAVGLVVYLAIQSPTQDDSQPATAPDIAMQLEKSGPPTHLKDLRGKVVLIDFWATWCLPCRISMPGLEKIYEKYKDQGLVVIGISTDDSKTRDEVPKTVKDLGVTYPIVYADDIFDLHEKYEWASLPKLYVIDKKGKERNLISGVGPSTEADLDKEVAQHLKEKGP